MKIIKSLPCYHTILTEIALNSKKFWGYPDEWMQLWKGDLVITEEFIYKNEVYHLADQEYKIVGFYAFVINENYIYLDSLFILPEYIGKGLGKILINDLLQKVKEFGHKTIILESEPFAEDFYKKYGFETIDLKPTKIEGRFLPIMEKKI